jgi:hypothetical protein
VQAPRFTGVVRVTNPREEIELATQIGLEKKREGYSPEALVLAVDEVLHNLQLSRAIVLFVQSTVNHETDTAVERPFSWFSVLVSLGFAAACLWLIYALLGQVGPTTGPWIILVVVLGQAMLFRLALRGARLSFMSACDWLNNASYPTNLHPLRNTNSTMGMLRLRRLRALVVDTADRMVAGENPESLVAELADVNLTSRAARFVVRLAQANVTLRDYLPPYTSRWLAYTLALVFGITVMVLVERMGNRLADSYRVYAYCVAGLIAGGLMARPRRKTVGGA